MSCPSLHRLCVSTVCSHTSKQRPHTNRPCHQTGTTAASCVAQQRSSAADACQAPGALATFTQRGALLTTPLQRATPQNPATAGNSCNSCQPCNVKKRVQGPSLTDSVTSPGEGIVSVCCWARWVVMPCTPTGPTKLSQAVKFGSPVPVAAHVGRARGSKAEHCT